MSPAPSPSQDRPRVLIVVSPILEESATKILKGVASFQRSHGTWDTFWDNELRSLHDTQWLRNGQWDGVISRHTNALQVETCRSFGIPLVDVNNATPFAGVPNVQLDNVSVGHLGGEHFLDRGFRNFGFLSYAGQSWSKDRQRGFVEALDVAGRKASLLELEQPPFDSPEAVEAMRKTVCDWLAELPKPVGVMACHDHRALLLIQAAQSMGLRVPEDVAVLGANNDEARCELSNPPLSSVATKHSHAGLCAAKILHGLMRGKAADPRDMLVDPDEVITRQSTDVLAADDRRIAQAVRLIHQGACKNITVPEIAREVGMARTQLEQKFRKFFARSPQAEIRRVQLARIRQLLIDTDLPLRAIADLTGFNHSEYLSVFFKRQTGESPGRYRRRSQQVAA